MTSLKNKWKRISKEQTPDKQMMFLKDSLKLYMTRPIGLIPLALATAFVAIIFYLRDRWYVSIAVFITFATITIMLEKNKENREEEFEKKWK